MEKIKIFIVDDHEVVRLGLQGLFARYEELEIVGEAASGEEAVQVVPVVKPDVVLLDVRLQGIHGADTCRLITSAVPGIKVVMLSSFAEPEEVQAAFTAGASAYVLKNITSGNVIKAIKAVMQGESFIDPEITEQVMCLIRGEKATSQISGLSKREEEILELVGEGKTNKEIGRELFLSEKTVRNHVSRILDKLGVSNRSQAAAFMARRSVIEQMVDDKK
ncbi:response regulator [Dethiobacter alkaliphilus]|uniref:response regulator n=1 Tax=Dethiobacter alkaliphilus TaxID=427926 RepID=UPI002226073D|nr:response regulator transcription factor [Dethiobacter alkaliphilus]MCW3489589.1 response regulator transcription factor [Dethiobacter alkaliphilus]